MHLRDWRYIVTHRPEPDPLKAETRAREPERDRIERTHQIIGILAGLAGIAMLGITIIVYRAERPPQVTAERQVNTVGNRNAATKPAASHSRANSGNANSVGDIGNELSPSTGASKDGVASEKTGRKVNSVPTPMLGGSNAGKPGTRIRDSRSEGQQGQTRPGSLLPGSRQAPVPDVRSEHRSTPDVKMPKQLSTKPSTLPEPTPVANEAPNATKRVESSPPPLNPPISGGVLQGNAVFKPEPSYPSLAKTFRVSGVVVVEVEIDEKGKVFSARALSGHPLLRDEAVRTANRCRFNPTFLSGKPVQVKGTITFNFHLE